MTSTALPTQTEAVILVLVTSDFFEDLSARLFLSVLEEMFHFSIKLWAEETRRLIPWAG